MAEREKGALRGINAIWFYNAAGKAFISSAEINASSSVDVGELYCVGGIIKYSFSPQSFIHSRFQLVCPLTFPATVGVHDENNFLCATFIIK